METFALNWYGRFSFYTSFPLLKHMFMYRVSSLVCKKCTYKISRLSLFAVRRNGTVYVTQLRKLGLQIFEQHF